MTATATGKELDLLTAVSQSDDEYDLELIEILCEFPSRELRDEDYYHGVLSPVEARFMLTKNGSFLVRLVNCEADAFKGLTKYMLSIRWQDEHFHLPIKKVPDRDLYYIYDHSSMNIPELIEWHCYTQHPIMEGGACIKYAAKRRDWSLYTQQILIGKKLGSGEFGLVYNGKMLTLFRPNISIVIKMLQKTAEMDLLERSRLLREAHLMMSLKHKNIVRVHGVCCDGDQMMMILEKASRGALLDYLKQARDAGQPVSERRKLSFCSDLIHGMAYLESENVVHRDLAARNCLISGGYWPRLKVTDFGLSFFGAAQLRLRDKAPLRWLAPEVLWELSYSSKSDTWSYGVVLYEIFSNGSRPYDELAGRADIVDYVMRRRETLKPPEGTPQFIVDIMRSCFEFEPSRRPTLCQIRDAMKWRDLGRLLMAVAPTNDVVPQKTDAGFKSATSSSTGA